MIFDSIGLSDRFDEEPTLAQRNEDIMAVIEAVGWDRAHFLGVSEGGAMGQLFAADFAEHVESLILLNTFVSPRCRDRMSDYSEPGDPPIKLKDEIVGQFLKIAEHWSEDPRYMVEWEMPSATANEAFVRWVGRLQRMAFSPKDFVRQLMSIAELDAGDAPEHLRGCLV